MPLVLFRQVTVSCVNCRLRLYQTGPKGDKSVFAEHRNKIEHYRVFNKCVSDRGNVNQDDKGKRFEEAFLPHLSAAHNLARWLVHDDHEADDIVQDAFLRALRFFHAFRGGDSRAWLLTIVRNRCYTWLRNKSLAGNVGEFDEMQYSPAVDDASDAAGIKSTDPEVLLARLDDASLIHQALESLPEEFREAIVLRELEDMSYKQIATITGVPMGTVMSRIARGRKMLLQRLQCLEQKKK